MYMSTYTRGLNLLQKISMSLMAILVLITFFAANLHAILWQSSDWLVSAVLPSVVVQLTNNEREANAAAPLRRNSSLDEAARLKAEHMAENEYFSHYSPDGVSPWSWFDEVGYVYAFAGENLAIHFTDSSELVEAWMKSPTHRKNIVDNKFTEIGVGTAKGKFEGYDTVYVVQLFGAPGVTSLPKTTPAPAEVSSVAVTESEIIEEEVSESVELATAPVSVEELVVESEFTPTPVETPTLNGVAATQPEVTPEIVEEPTVVAVAPVKEEIEPVAAPDLNEVVVLESPIISTSSGLAVAQITTPPSDHAGATIASVATQPNQLLQIVYVTLGVMVLFLLSTSIVLEARRFHYRQVAYGILLIFVMGGLWFTHTLLTTGAVIV